MIGKTISHYKILEKLGEGGMGEVYLAEDFKLKRKVAMKTLPHHLIVDEEARKRFTHEAQAASVLDHPNICTIHEISETDDGQSYIVMAYCEGETLREKIKRGPLKIDVAIAIAIRIAEGLVSAHIHYITHRDIKPANIMINKDGVVKIVDFGLAKLTSQSKLTKKSEIVGTTEYMSPEQAQGQAVDYRSDIWALGVILYEMITGRVPFEGEYDQSVIYNIINVDPEPVTGLRTGVPMELERIITKALMKDPDQRYQHVDEMLVDLKTQKSASKISILEKQNSTKIHVPGKKLNIIGIALITVLLVIIFYLVFISIPKSPESKTLAVLPFKNLNQKDESDYFSDGVTEDIITQLSKIRDLKVISRTTCVRYKDSDKNIHQIGDELNVANILEGSVRREGESVRITAQLIDVQHDKHIWAESYDRQLINIFELQSDVAREIASALKVELSAKVQKQFEKQPTNNFSAYNYYLKGRDYYYRYQNEHNENAITLFKSALEVDPDFALAFAGMADAYAQRTQRFGLESFWLDTAITASNKALLIDPNLSEAYKALGSVYHTKGWFYKSLEANRRALDFNPNYDPAIANIGLAYLEIGRYDEAVHWLKKAFALNPANSAITSGIAQVFLYLGEYLKAEEWFEKTIILNPSHRPNPNIGLIMIAILKGQYGQGVERGIKEIENKSTDANTLITAGDAALHFGNPSLAIDNYNKALTIDPTGWNPYSSINLTTSLGYILWKTNQRAEAELLFEKSIKMDQETLQQKSKWWGVAYDLAAINAIQGNKNESIKWLEKAKENGWRFYRWAEIDPLFENIRYDKEFLNLMIELKNQVDIMKEQINSDS